MLNQHDVQLVEQCLIEISNISLQNDVFLIATTNHLDRIDPRVLRGGRFSEKIQISLPSMELRQRLFARFIDGLPLAPDATFPELAKLSEALSHADIQAVCEAAKRFAHRRARDDQKPTLRAEDFLKAMESDSRDEFPILLPGSHNRRQVMSARVPSEHPVFRGTRWGQSFYYWKLWPF